MLFHAQGGSREARGRKGAVQGSQINPLDGTIAGLVEGGSREARGRKGAVQGSQINPLDGTIAGLVEGDTFFRTPLATYSQNAQFLARPLQILSIAA